MTSLSVFDLLAMHDVLADLPATWLHRLADAGHPVYRRSGDRLFREDTVADRFWLLHAGAVVIDFHVPGRGDIVVDRAGPGALVGCSWLRTPYRWRFGAVVAEDIRAVEFNAKRVRELMAEDALLGRELTTRVFDVVAERLHAARHRLVELYAYPGQES
jgi:CRP/FNR family transcriptional regulator, cyclic AMP receptor protein